MTDTKPTRPPRRRLLTRDQVISELRRERAQIGLTATAARYGLSAQQICDVLSFPPRAQLSKRMWTALKYRCWEYFERLPE